MGRSRSSSRVWFLRQNSFGASRERKRPESYLRSLTLPARHSLLDFLGGDGLDRIEQSGTLQALDDHLALVRHPVFLRRLDHAHAVVAQFPQRHIAALDNVV